MLPNPIRASVHEDAIGRVTSFFNATATDMIGEVFQNARRSGATRIEVTVRMPDGAAGRRLVTVEDNGCGIADPAALLAFGHSAWNDRAHENPAGMGIYALASTTSSIRSRTAGNEGWEVTLEPAHYRGEAEAVVRAAPEGTPVGTRIQFSCAKFDGDACARAARYLPVKVWVNGKRAAHDDFQTPKNRIGATVGDDVTLVIKKGYLARHEAAEGARRAVMHDRRTSINFHGHIVNDELQMPVVCGISDVWYADIDVHRCENLGLVLPARKEVIRNAFVDQLRERAEKAIFEALDTLAAPPALPASSWRRGNAVLGRPLRRRKVQLEPWAPRTPYNENERTEGDTGGPRTPSPTALLVPPDLHAPQQMMLATALEIGDNEQLALYEDDKRYLGFDDYDRLYKVRDATLIVTETDGTTHRADDDGYPCKHRTVRDMELVLDCRNDAGGTPREVRLKAHIGFCNHYLGTYPEGIGILVTEDTEPDPGTLEELVMTAFFVENEYEDESTETQRQKFQDRARQQIDKLLLPGATAAERAIQRALDDKVGPLLRDDGPFVIRYEPFKKCTVDTGAAAK